MDQSNIPVGHWFLKENIYDTQITKYKNHLVDPYGYHTNDCDGIQIKTNSSQVVFCCGKTICFFCGTPLHGCTNNIIIERQKKIIKCHEFCYDNHKKID